MAPDFVSRQIRVDLSASLLRSRYSLGSMTRPPSMRKIAFTIGNSPFLSTSSSPDGVADSQFRVCSGLLAQFASTPSQFQPRRTPRALRGGEGKPAGSKNKTRPVNSRLKNSRFLTGCQGPFLLMMGHSAPHGNGAIWDGVSIASALRKASRNSSW